MSLEEEIKALKRIGLFHRLPDQQEAVLEGMVRVFLAFPEQKRYVIHSAYSYVYLDPAEAARNLWGSLQIHQKPKDRKVYIYEAYLRSDNLIHSGYHACWQLKLDVFMAYSIPWQLNRQ